MKLHPVHIAALTAALFLWVSCQDDQKRIPRGEMVEIFTEMFMQDQMVHYDRDLLDQADSSLVYEGIFREHGFDTDDYLYSLKFYLRDPEKMAKIMNEVGVRLKKRSKEMDPLIAFQELQGEMMALYKRPVSKLLPQPVLIVDTLKVQRNPADSGAFYRYSPEPGLQLDTLVLLPERDTVAVAPADTVERQKIGPVVNLKEKLK